MPDQPLPPTPARRMRPERLGLAILAVLAFGTLCLRAVNALPQPTAPQLPALPPLAAAKTAAPLTRSSGSALGLGVTLDRGAVTRGGDGLVRMELTVKADDTATGTKVDSDFVVVLDRSGSMAGDRLTQAQNSVIGLLDSLSPRDRFGLVIYDDAAQVLVPLSYADAGARQRWRKLVAGIDVGGSTNMSDGLDRGLALMQGARQSGRAGRLILLSDGHANTGDASPEGLRARGRRAAQHELVLSTVGIGDGFNEYLMTQIADAGTGNYHYLADNTQLAQILDRELSSTRTTVASGLSVRIAPKPGVQVIDAAGYPLASDASGTSFHVGSLFAGQERRVWVSLRVPSDREGELPLGAVELAYTEGGQRKRMAAQGALAVRCVSDEHTALASIDKGAWERAVAQEEWGRVQEQVARAVHEGKREDAMQTLTAYRSQYSALNAKIGSAAVDGSLTESETLEQQVVQAFEGADQVGKQNLFSKEQSAKGRKFRRIGSEKLSN
ncbi:MAG TPA: VWA domain-containing protein [Polyangiales bacterium]|nr:VWA domain-containing protein [Polyangiales bacterium]